MSVAPIDLSGLAEGLADPPVRIEPLRADHRDALAAACAQDADIWQMYAVSFDVGHFDGSFDALLADPARVPLAIVVDGAVAGMTAWIKPDPCWRTAEIGNTYLAPAYRGTGVNEVVKRLLLDRGFALGLLRIQFAVDVRNARSQAACLKIGAVREGVLRNDRVTWTGHQRDTAIFSIVARDRA